MTTSNGGQLDYSDLIYHRKNHQMEVFVKKSMKTSKPAMLEQHIQGVLNSYPGLAKQVVLQCDMMLKLMRYIVLCYYEGVMGRLYPDIEELPLKENLISKLIQQQLLNKETCYQYILEASVVVYYGDLNSRGSRGSGQRHHTVEYEHEVTLDRTLMPRSVQGNNTFLFPTESDDESSTLTEVAQRQKEEIIMEEEKEEDEELSQLQQMHSYNRSLGKREVQKIIRQSEMIAHENRIPYHETFPTLLRLIRAVRPYQKLKRIQTIDQLIVQIFMRCRSQSQYSQLYDTIMATDNKAEILFFILYKFQRQYPHINLQRQLYLPLCFMNDFDGVLHPNVKNFFCPYFGRFFSIVETFVYSDI